ncbi:ATP-binding protein [Microbacterium sp. BG28]|uniref:ATP-binding protein n=1 Tax=Microbacterium sp. BG28 TaxID=3097356 RepID=UPI002A5A08C1|nr:ATP-binding protein [Microbacterium sp. BG28]MDY0830047.1 ATP-binding protein [Microbacterium sp. BG28]
MAFGHRQRAVRLAMLVLPSVVTLAALGVTTTVALALQESRIRDATAERVQEVATSLAALSEVRKTVASVSDAGSPDDLADAADLAPATAALQPIAELVARAAGVYYVVVTDDEGVRITHPLASERGVQVSTTNASVLAGTPFLGTETGPSGPSLRAKVPVVDEGRVVGMVAVGVLESDIAAEREQALSALLPWAVGALIVATLASSALTAAVERRFRRLDELALEHAQMGRTAAALREQSHEFTTRLHVVHGLVSRGDADEALAYIEDLVPVSGGRHDEQDAGMPLRDAAVHAVRSDVLAHGAQVEFDVAVARDIDEEVVTVLTNLGRNAAEAGAGRIRCTLREHGDLLAGAVEDDGPGVDPRQATRIFALGFSSKSDASGSGRGIGLDLVRRLVTARGGTIEVGTSTLGGARFSFEMARRP